MNTTLDFKKMNTTQKQGWHLEALSVADYGYFPIKLKQVVCLRSFLHTVVRKIGLCSYGRIKPLQTGFPLARAGQMPDHTRVRQLRR